MKRFFLGVSCALLAALAAVPAEAAGPQKFWVNNESWREIYHVYVQRDTSGGNRDLLGENGVIPPYDRARTLRPRSNYCYSDVAIVSRDDEWVWFYDVNICDHTTILEVNNGDF